MDVHPDIEDPRRIIAGHPEMVELQARADAQGTSAWCARGQHQHCRGRKMLADYSFAHCACGCHQPPGR